MFKGFLLLCLLTLTGIVGVQADNTDWKVYASYHNATKCVEMGGRVYVLANGDLYSYGPEDGSIETYDKATALSDFDIYDIQVSSGTHELVVLYQNGNIDLLATDGTAYNVSELKSKTMSDKTLNDVVTVGNTIYISTNAGIVEFDLNQRIFKNLYYFGYAVKSVCVSDGYIVAITAGGVYRGNQSKNLLDPANWEKINNFTTFKKIVKLGNQYYFLANNLYKVTSLTPYAQTLALPDAVTSCFVNNGRIYLTTNAKLFKSVDEAGNVTTHTVPYPISSMAYLSGTYWAACGENGMLGMGLSGTTFEVKTGDITPNSPIRNNSYRMNMVNGRLLVAGGNNYWTGTYALGQATAYENGRWTMFDEKEPTAAVPSLTYLNVTDVAQDPDDPTHHYLATFRSGIYEFKDYKLYKHYTYYKDDQYKAADPYYVSNPLQTMNPSSSHYFRYIRMGGCNYDKDGNLWMFNMSCDTIVRILKKDGTWLGYYYDDIARYQVFDRAVFDKRGWVWINSRLSLNVEAVTGKDSKAGVLIVNTNGTINTQRDDTHKFYHTLVNQDGTEYAVGGFYAVAEDLDGVMWFGTSAGVFVTETPENIFNSNFYFTQIKLSRDDGTGLADYLLNGVTVTCIAVDGANRKWIGTGGNGLYLLSADGQQTLQRFTVDNSPLLSDNINDIQIDGETGEVFFSTDKGLCSYLSDAVDAEEELDKNNLKVYPNPVRPEDRNLVRVTGLAFNTNVKIANAAGKLVYEGTSNGGEFTWNCRTSAGKQVASGVYYILATDEEGKKGASAKVLIVR